MERKSGACCAANHRNATTSTHSRSNWRDEPFRSTELAHRRPKSGDQDGDDPPGVAERRRSGRMARRLDPALWRAADRSHLRQRLMEYRFGRFGRAGAVHSTRMVAVGGPSVSQSAVLDVLGVVAVPSTSQPEPLCAARAALSARRQERRWLHRSHWKRKSRSVGCRGEIRIWAISTPAEIPTPRSAPNHSRRMSKVSRNPRGTSSAMFAANSIQPEP